MILWILVFLEQFLECFCGIAILSCFFEDKRRREIGYQVLQGSILVAVTVLNTYNMLFCFVSLGQVLVMAAMCAIYSMLVFKIPGKQAFAWTMFWNNTCLLLRTFVLLITAIKEEKNVPDVNLEGGSYLKLIAVSVFLLCLIGVFYALYAKHKCVIQLLITQRYLMLFITGVVEWVLIFFLFYAGWYDVGGVELFTGVLCITVVLILVLLQIILSQQHIVNAEKAAITIQKNMMEKQYSYMKEKYEEEQKRLHNKKYELQSMVNLSNQTGKEQSNCFDNNQELMEKKAASVWTGQAELDVLLYMTRKQCDENQIVFQVSCDACRIPFQSSDFCIIMGNLLDNAVEAASLSQKNERFIRLTLKTVSGMLLLEIANSYKNEPVQKADGRFRSMKDGPEHGWGIESVRDIVKQYEGTMEVKFENRRFCVTILI